MLNFFKRKRSRNCQFIAPMSGEIIAIQDVPDEVFSEKMMGDGFAVNPSSGLVCSPCDGEILQIFPTSHAIVLKSTEGLEMIIHIGLDTVKLKGEGFKRLIEVGKHVKAGDLLLEIDLDYVKNHAKSLISPIVITNVERIENMKIHYKTCKMKDHIGHVSIIEEG